VLALPTMLTMLDISVLFLALPRLTADLGASATQQLWISDIYGFLIAGFLVTMGTLGDRVGRRRVLLLGAAAFGVISVVAAYSSSPEMLIICRAALGIAGATIMPSTLALIMSMFRNPKEMGTAIAVWASALTGGVALGPVVGGVLLHWFWWGSVFLIGVPIMLLLLATGPSLLPEFKNPAGGRLDPTSVVLSLVTILPFVYGFKEIARTGWHTRPVVSVVIGVLFGVIFIARQRRLANPLLDLRLFTIRAVSGALVLSLLVAAVQGGSGFFVAQYLQVVEGLSPLKAGLWVLVPTFALILGIFMSQGMAQKVRPAYIVTAGMGLAAVGMLVLTQISATSGVGVLLIGFTVVYIGVSPVGPLVSQLVVPSAPPEKAGSAASLQSTSGELGVALGIAALGSVGVAVYRGHVGVPAEIAGTPAGDAARETISGALTVAQNLPSQVAGSLVDSARAAFTSGLNTAAAVCVVAFVGLAVLAISTLRHIPPMARPQGAPGPAEEEPQAQAERASAA
jgi:DHA2 family multidrug resistance protein-like MFS transporter